MSRPRVHLAPAGSAEFLAEAIRRGGGEPAAAAEADALVWADPRDPAALGALLAAAPQIRWVQLLWAGVEQFAAARIFDRERIWTSSKGVCALPVAEHALALALAGLRQLRQYARARSWGEQAGISLVGRRVVIFGGGGVAGELARLLEPFACRVTVVRRRPRPMVGADRVLSPALGRSALADADLVVLALALTPETTGLIDHAALAGMPRHAWLVNVARGAHVVTDDLVAALRTETIAGAALDVTEPEPLPDDHPLWSLPNCLITPHTANTDAMARPLLARRVTENIQRFAAKRPLLGRIDPELGY